MGKASGLALLPKLKYEHIYLTSFSKMRVDLAAQVHHTQTLYLKKSTHCITIQVLSESVSKALELTKGSCAEETAKFVDYMDKFFDALNVSNFNAGKKKRKPLSL